jgi:hypothetical protein
MSENAGCAWIFGLAVAGFVAICLVGAMTSQKEADRDLERFKSCVESGGAWDGWWKSCTREPTP